MGAYFSQFAVLLKLGHQTQHLLRCCDDLILQVKSAVFRCLVQEVTIVHHDATRVRNASRAGVSVPVEPPHGGTVLQVEVSHRVESVASSLLPVEIPGAETHQGGLQDTGQPLRVRPLTGADQLTEGLGGRGSWGRVGGLFHLLPLLLREEIRAPTFLPVLAEQALEPGGEAWDWRQAGEHGHVRELALKDIKRGKEVELNLKCKPHCLQIHPV